MDIKLIIENSILGTHEIGTIQIDMKKYFEDSGEKYLIDFIEKTGVAGVSSECNTLLCSRAGSEERAGLQDGVVEKLKRMIEYYGKKVDENIRYKRYDKIVQFQHMKKALENLDEYIEHGSFFGES